MRKILIKKLIVLPVLFFLVFFVSACATDSQVCFSGKCFYVEVVSRPSEMAKGLMFRKSLDYDKGMLFIFEKFSEHNFWMKNTLIPLDIIWIDENNKVVFIKKNAQPCKDGLCESIRSGEKAKYVLEVNTGICSDFGLKVGDFVDIKIREYN